VRACPGASPLRSIALGLKRATPPPETPCGARSAASIPRARPHRRNYGACARSIARGTTLRILITDGDTLNRPRAASHSLALADLPDLTNSLAFSIASAETTACTSDSLCLADYSLGRQELPNIPLSQINVIDGRPTPAASKCFANRLASESSVAARRSGFRRHLLKPANSIKDQCHHS